MHTYSILRQIADSWVMLAMFGFFAGAAIWAYLPSQRRARDDASLIPFRNDDAPKTCAGTCATCASKVLAETFAVAQPGTNETKAAAHD